MRRFLLAGSFSCFVFLAAFSLAEVDAQAQQPSISAPATPIPLVYPLFVEDGDFTSTLIMVNGSAMSTYADVALRSPDGTTVATQRVQFPPFSQQQINIRSMRNSGTEPNITHGSITLTQSQSLSGIAIVGTIAITQLSSSVPHYIDEEPTRPGASSSQTLRGVADGSVGSPLVAIASLSTMPQHVTISCLAGNSAVTSTVTVAPEQTVLTPACSRNLSSDSDLDWYVQNLPDIQHGPVGLALTSDAAPGSYTAFSLAPHDSPNGRYFSSVTLSDPTKLQSTTTVYPGVPVGASPLLPGGTFTPVLTLANFSQSPRHVIVNYALTQNGAANLTPVQSVTLAPMTSQQVTLGGLTGDTVLQDSFMVQSDGSPGDVETKLVSTSNSVLQEVESLGKDEDNPANGGDHPWTVANGTTSTLLLFNNSAQPQYFNVQISAGATLWRKSYQLQPMQTLAVSINELMSTGAKDDYGNAFPSDIWQGQVGWHMTTKGSGRGRLMQSNPNTAMARSFSCQETMEACQQQINNLNFSIENGEVVDFGTVETLTCFDTCNGSPGGWGGQGYSYSWSSNNSSIASISGPNYNQSANVYGAGVGSTSISTEVWDAYCQVYANWPAAVITVNQSPSQIKMSTGDTGTLNVVTSPSSFAPGILISYGMTSNPNSAYATSAKFSPPGTFTGNDNWKVSATSSSNSPSGIFIGTACVNAVCASQTTTIIIPPQLLIQMMYAEAGGTNQTAMQSLGETIENRFSSPLFDNTFYNWQNSLVSGQVALNTSITTGVQPELNAAVNVFTDTNAGWCGALSWWSPTSAQWSSVQNAISSGTTTFPSGTGAPTYNSSVWPTSSQQILYVSSVGIKSGGVPNFLYLATRTSSQAAAVSSSCN